MKKEIVKQFTHLLAGFLLLVHGFQAFERDDPETAFVFLGIGVVFLIIAGIHPWLVRRVKKINVFFFLLEAAAISYSAWHYSIERNGTMVTVSMLLALFFVWYALFVLFTKSHRHRKRRRVRRSSPEMDL